MPAQSMSVPSSAVRVGRGEANTGSVAGGATVTVAVPIVPDVSSNAVVTAGVLDGNGRLQVVSVSYRGGTECGVIVRNLDSVNAQAGTVMVVAVQA